jgi:transcriptional regulator with XRE-family HTH domain
MPPNRLSTTTPRPNLLGEYLKNRRSRLDPAALGISSGRRRTAGLRREELAQRAAISVTWYTWLEQGRGGGPSPEVLGRIAKALLLTEVEREHLFLLAFGPGAAHGLEASEGIPPRLQRVLDACTSSPAYLKTRTWDVVAWNDAANAVFGYDRAAKEERNLLRRMFLDPAMPALLDDWMGVARFVVSTFRADAARAPAREAAEVQSLVAELCQRSADFDRLWREHDVRAHGDGVKRLRLSGSATLDLEYSAFVVEERPALTMVIFNPVNQADSETVRRLTQRAAPRDGGK